MGTLKTPWRYWLVPQNKKKKKRNTSSLIQSFCQRKLLGIFCVCACVCVTLSCFFFLSHFWLWLASFPPHDFARLRWCCNNPYYILYIIKWLSRPFFFFSYSNKDFRLYYFFFIARNVAGWDVTMTTIQGRPLFLKISYLIGCDCWL